MLCRQCGTEIADKAIICYKCGTATAVPGAGAAARRAKGPMVPLWLWVILAAALGAAVWWHFR